MQYFIAILQMVASAITSVARLCRAAVPRPARPGSKLLARLVDPRPDTREPNEKAMPLCTLSADTMAKVQGYVPGCTCPGHGGRP